MNPRHPFILTALLVLALAACRPGANPPEAPTVVRQYPVMGTMAEVKLYGDAEVANRAADAIRDEFSTIEQVCSTFAPESELSRLNREAGQAPFACSEQLWPVLMASKKFHAFSDGAFDITARPLMELWGFYRKRGELPDEKEIAAARAHVGLEKVVFDATARTVRFLDPEVRLDLGGIAKGYAVERAVAIALDQGIRAGTINLGGNLACLPDPPLGREHYLIGVRHPRHRDELCGTIIIPGGYAMATSGDYEKSVELAGRRFTHIMDPATGQPVADMMAVTVVTPLATDSDALSTAIFVQGEELARRAVAEIPGTRVLIIRAAPAAPGGAEILRFGPGWDDCHL